MSTTLYLARESWLHRLNPLTKLVALLSILVIAFAAHWWWIPAAIAAALVAIGASADVAGRLSVLSGRILAPILLVLLGVQGLTYPGSTVLVDLGPLAVTAEGLQFAALIGSRLLCLVVASVLLILTTHPGKLLTALTEAGFSPKFAYLIAATLQLIPSFQDRARRILLAQQARGLALPTNPLRRAGRLLPLVGPLVLGMFTDLEDRTLAMEARGFSSTAKRTTLEPVPDSGPQRVVRWLFPLLAVAVAVLPGLMARS